MFKIQQRLRSVASRAEVGRRLTAVSIALVTATAGLIVASATPANAAGSVLNIGHTIYSGGKVKGSGSMYNDGDWTNVCVVLMQKSRFGVQDLTKACKTTTRQNIAWSAPDYGYSSQSSCMRFYTRISAYRNGTRMAEKVSNTIAVNC